MKKLSIFEYNARLHEEPLKQEGSEDGLEDGRKEIKQNAFRKGYTPEQIAEFTGAELEEVMKVREKMLQP